MTDTNINSLIVNKMTMEIYKQQKALNNINANESYEVTDIDDIINQTSNHDVEELGILDGGSINSTVEDFITLVVNKVKSINLKLPTLVSFKKVYNVYDIVLTNLYIGVDDYVGNINIYFDDEFGVQASITIWDAIGDNSNETTNTGVWYGLYRKLDANISFTGMRKFINSEDLTNTHHELEEMIISLNEIVNTQIERLDGIDTSIANINQDILDTNKDIDAIIDGNIPVAKADVASSVASQRKILVEDTYKSRVTATDNNEIGDESTAEARSIKAQTVKQVLKETGKVLTSKTPIKSIEGKVSEVIDGVIKISQPSEIVSRGGNLFDGELELGDYSAITGLPTTSNTTVRSKNFARLSQGYQYTTKRYDINVGFTYYFYELNGDFIGYQGYGSPSQWFPQSYFDSLNRDVLVKIVFLNTTDTTIQVMLNQGTTPLPYEPYREDIITLDNIDLPKLPNGVGDRILPDGRVERNVGKRLYQVGDELDSSVVTDMVDTYYQLATPTYEAITIPSTINTFTNGSVELDGIINLGHLHSHNCQIGEQYYVSSKAGLKVTNGIEEFLMPYGYVKFTAGYDSEYWIEYLKDGVSETENAQWLCISEMGNEDMTQEDIRVAYGNRVYEYGLTDSVINEFTSVGDNLWDWEYFYNTLKTVNSDNINIVYKDGRKCLEIKAPSVYANVKLYQGKFSPNVQYKISMEIMNPIESGLSIIMEHTDGAKVYMPTTTDGKGVWNIISFSSLENKTLDCLTLAYFSSSTLYINIDKFQLTHASNPITTYEPYIEHKLIIPEFVGASLPNGVRDEVVKIGGKWYKVKNVGQVTFDGSKNWILQSSDTLTNTLRFTLDNSVPNNGVALYDKGNATSNIFTHQDDSGISTDNEGFALRNDSVNRIYVRINKTRLSTLDATGFKQYLSQNPLIVKYQLAQPEFIELPDFDNNITVYNYGMEEFNDVCKSELVYTLNDLGQIETNRTNIESILEILSRNGIS